ncbi:hypothetical protein AC482_03550 [miscellaneous Crenarchaeota group-15 archaeon DG-45]|uniref:Uncharacterized protein n=1 Tax=miscellaneous Crenarchaeota group-15 archaeon DG-45 TaxID=1685127 RepID=A0A0M0BQP1_9ARCH|nr:MAG: hypothetical protein AC482_03550 [miscellaneous Crenarchaeota group-15 archaeon DG-45]
MAERRDQVDLRIIYTSLIIIVILAVLMGLTSEKISSLLMLFFIAIIIIGNVGYLYRIFKRNK